MARLADIDAVTLDANGTLVGLVDPVPKLERILREHGVDRTPEAIRRAFETEGKVYAARAAETHEPTAFAALQRDCASVFLAEAGADSLDAGAFAPLYVGAFEFAPLPGVVDALRFLRRCGIELAVVANFDQTLPAWLERLRLRSWLAAVVTPGEAGAAKPDPRIFELALARLGVEPQRALHIGDGVADEDGAHAAGMHFEWAPVSRAIARWTATAAG